MKKNTQIKIIVISFTILIALLTYYRIKTNSNKQSILEQQTAFLFKKINTSTTANITKHLVYGTHFNIEGTVDIPKISGISISKVNVIIQNPNNDEHIIDSNYTYKDGILAFYTTAELNNGLYLENLIESTYYVFLEVVLSNNEVNYYSLSKSDKSKYQDITYYTVTKNNSNNKINIFFDKYNDISFLGLVVTPIEKIPNDVYDFVIDPGHGGLDSGLKYNNYTESDLVLDCGIKLKENLEELGFKVILTRNKSQNNNENTYYNMYDDNGRVTVANKSHAKLLISLHMNNSTTKNSKGGVEVYAPSNCNLDFAKQLADNIVSTAITSYSSAKSYKKFDGVYVQNFTNSDILAYKNTAIKKGYEPYNITTSTPYIYIIRETGGIATNAFVDGRNKTYGANKYINSNVGIESYLIKLGYMKSKNDLQNIVKNQNLYAQAIANSITELFN